MRVEGAFFVSVTLDISGLMRSQARQFAQKLKTYEIPVMREWDHEMTWYTILAGGKRVHDAKE
jgi:hypothetical protein